LDATVWPGVSVVSGQQGAPEYPILTVTLAVPAAAHDFSVEVKNKSSISVGEVHFPPSARSSSNGITERTLDPKLANWDSKATVTKAQTFRSLRTVIVQIPLATQSGGSVSALTQFTVDLKFRGAVESAPVRDPVFEDMNRRLVANPGDLSRFSIPLRQNAKPLPVAAQYHAKSARPQDKYDSTSFTWINPKATYIKLFVVRDGLYRVNVTNLPDQFNLAQHGFTADSLRLLNHGVEVPIWIDKDGSGNVTAIEFYGEHLRGFPLDGLPEYYNVATDTNIYWLTNIGIGTPLRYTPRSLDPSGAVAITSGEVLLHHEQDHEYFQGDVVTDQATTIHRTQYGTAANPWGERFIWSFLDWRYAPILRDSFFIAGIPSGDAELAFLFRGITSNRHKKTIRLNGNTIYTVLDTGIQYDAPVLHVPATFLHPGANVVEIEALFSGDSLDQWYFDHYTVRYSSPLEASTDSAIAKGQWLTTITPPGSPYRLPFPSDAHVYNLTDRTRILPQGGSFIENTASPRPEYAAATSTSLLAPSRITIWDNWKILDRQNQVDYLVITHPLFLPHAQKLAARRALQGLKTMVATTDEVFNAFDYGSAEPEAIRRFLNYAYFYYSGTPIAMTTLLGDASWDPKKNVASSNQTDFVPSYGRPVSDYLATLIDVGNTDTMTPRLLIARIPVASVAEADGYLAKLQEYEDQPRAEWNKNFLFVAGGAQGAEHQEFAGNDVYYLQSTSTGGLGLSTPPTNIHGTIIERRDFTQTDPSLVGPIQEAIQFGQSFFYFSGHGATFTTDVILPEARLLRNKGLYPLFSTLSCATGAFAEPDQVSVNESYVRVPEAGSVQAYGTTGFGDASFGSFVMFKWIELLRTYRQTHDTTRPLAINMTDLFTQAKLFALRTSGGGASLQNDVMQFTMLGDVATGFALRPQPELALHSPDVRVTSITDSTPRKIFNVNDSTLIVNGTVHNYGYSASVPILVRIRDYSPKGLTFTYDTTLNSLDDSATVQTTFPLTNESIGRHRISITIDPLGRVVQSYHEDDSASLDIQVNGFSASPFYPYEGSRQFCDVDQNKVHFIVLTPSVANTNDQVELEVDTSRSFERPIVSRSAPITSGYYLTYDVPLPAAPIPSSSVYWWRTRLVRGNGDTAQWEYATFSTASAEHSELSYSSSGQLSSAINIGLSTNPSGALFLPLQDTLRFEAWAQGGHDSGVQAFHPISRLIQNNQVVYQFLGYDGYTILELSSDSTHIEKVFEFSLDFHFSGDPVYCDSIARIFDSVLASIPVGRKVVVMSSGQPAYPTFDNNASVTAALQSIGSAHGFEGLGFFESQAIIGRKGDPSGSALEQRSAANTNGAHVYDTLVTFGTFGQAQTPFTAVAKGYGKLKWSGEAAADRDIVFTILGSRRDGSAIIPLDTLHASQASAFDLSRIDARTYDRLAVKINFIRNTTATQSPTLSAIELEYDAAPEFIFTSDSIQTVPNRTSEGGTVVARYGVSLLTCTPADSALVQVSKQYSGKTTSIASHLIPHIDGHGTVTIIDTIASVSEQGLVGLTAVANPNEAQNEQLLFNNAISGSYFVGRDTSKPSAEILFADPPSYFNDHRIPQEGYVSRTSRITVNLLSSNLLRDTSKTSIVVDLQSYEGHGLLIPKIQVNDQRGYILEFDTFASGPLQARLRITPPPGNPFFPGLWSVTAYIADASGNRDTIEQFFTISAKNGIEHVMNYPNPFKEKTDITFQLKSDAPADVKVILYTVAGRKIRTILPTELRTGFNHVEWDGRDEKGNDVGNGTYLYRVVISGKNPDGSEVADGITEKAVRSR